MNLSYQKHRYTTLIFDHTEELCRLIDKYSSSRVLLIGTLSNSQKLPKQLLSIEANQVNQYLGQEFDCIIFDATSDFAVNSFTAIIGCLVGGGELILNLPNRLETKLNNPTFDYDAADGLCPLLYRLLKFIQLDSSKSLENANSPISSEDISAELSRKFHQQQQILVDKIKRCSLGHAKRPLVITANRGRGKSASLGIAAADLAKENNKKIIITAPSKANLTVFFKYAEQRLVDNLNVLKQNIIFMPPDAIIENTPDADLLIIDEAGAIPVQLLEKFALSYNRIVFSTTVDGYEGNGQGFEIRFKQKLTQIFPKWRSGTINAPIRWAQDDPLEYAVNSAFLLSHSVQQIPPTYSGAIADIDFQFIEKTQLLNNERLLKQIFSLLVEAHYQTRPSDLQRMLADDSMNLFVAKQDNQVIATALVCTEGELESDTCESIERGALRLPGHLLPQSLMAYQGDVTAGKLKFWRVMRIAVLATRQRQKIGHNLMNFIQQRAIKSSVDIIGTSFSLTSEVLQFWYQLNYRCSRLALRKDSSTGSYPGEFLLLINDTNVAARDCYLNALQRFSQSFLYCMTSSYRDIESSSLIHIAKFQLETLSTEISKDSVKEITRYINKARSYEMVEWSLRQAYIYWLINHQVGLSLTNKSKRLLLAKLLQAKPWQEIILEFEFEGKKAAQEAVRMAFSKIIPIFENTYLSKNQPSHNEML